MTIILFIIFAIFVFSYSIFSWGFVTFKFWYWFVLPLFPNLPQIDFWQAIGLMFFISLFKNQGENILKTEYINTKKTFIYFIITPWLLFIMGNIFKLN